MVLEKPLNVSVLLSLLAKCAESLAIQLVKSTCAIQDLIFLFLLSSFFTSQNLVITTMENEDWPNKQTWAKKMRKK